MLSVAGHEHSARTGERYFEHGVVLRVRDICPSATWDVNRRRSANVVEGCIHTRGRQLEFADGVAADFGEDILAGYVGKLAGEESVDNPFWHTVERERRKKDIRVDARDQ